MAGPSNPETLRRMYDAFARRDLDAFLEHCAPDVEIDSDIGSYPPGHDGIRGWWGDLTEAFAIGSPQVDLMADLGDVVLSFLTGLWRGHTSGVEFEAERIHLTRWRDGMAAWWGFYMSPEEAAAAAGLSEDESAGLDAVLRIRAAFAALNRRDLDAAIAPAHPDVEFHAHMGGAVEGATWRGRDGARQGFQETFAAFDTFDLDVREMRWLGDRCLTFAHLHARGSRSGIELDSPRIYLSTMRDGMVIRQDSFADEEAALAAAQVSP